jgi:hypothetical protein
MLPGIGLHHYNLNVVPAQKKKKGRVWMSRLDKMSVTEREVKLEDLTRGISLSGTIIKEFAGVVVTYDFYPVCSSFLFPPDSSRWRSRSRRPRSPWVPSSPVFVRSSGE